jgi:hypothetical protein
MPPPVEPPSPETHHAMARAIEAQRMAEELQRNPRLAVDRHIDQRFANLSDHKRAFIKRAWHEHRVDLTEPQNAQAMTRHYYAGLAQGIPDDSPEMDAHLTNVLEGRHIQPPENGNAEPSQMAEPSIERAAQQLDDQATAIRNVMNVEASTPLALAENLPAPEPMPRAKSIPFSAPVSRNVLSPSGRPVPDFRNITLSAAEREIARNSFTDPSMTNEQRERLYASNKALMLKRRAEGTLNE